MAKKLLTLAMVIALLAMAIPSGFACVINKPHPEAAFTAEPTSGTAPLEVQFTDQSTGEITGWKWDFDNDGTVDSTEQSPSHTYDTPGTYTVSLEVTGPGGSDTKTKVDYIEVYGSPVAGFSASPTSGIAPLEVQFTDQSTGEVTDWKWDFDNDGTVDSTEQSPSHTYDTPGTYTVSLEVTGPGGSDTETKSQYIEVLEPTLAPEVNFTAQPTSGTAPLQVQFTDQSTGEINDWQWDFDNDGTVDSTEQSPSYTYDTPGTYTVSLEVTGPGGSDTETKVDYITVTEEETTIYIPLLIPLSGAYASGYAIVDACAEALIDYVNTEDPIPGVTLQLLTYNSQGTSEQAIPGYQYLVEQGAKFIACADTTTAESLKTTVDTDKFPVFMMSGTPVATATPGYVFCIPMEYYNQVQPLMKWIMDNWDYTGTGRNPNVGLFAWAIPYGLDRQHAIEDYIAANPGKFDYAGAQMVSPMATSFTTQVEALKNCDYIFLGVTATAGAPFMALMRDSGYTDPVFCMLGSDTGFLSTYLVSPGKSALDGTIWASDCGYWKTDDNQIAELSRELLESYFTDSLDQKESIEAGGMPGLNTMVTSLLVPIEILREAVKDLDDPTTVTGEMIYDAATTMTFDYEGFPTMDYSNGKRALLLYEKVYEYSATADDWYPVSDWITAPEYE